MLYLTIKIPRWCKFTKCIRKKFSAQKNLKKKEEIVKRAGAGAIEFWAKRTRACGRKLSVRMCVRARQTTVATHRLVFIQFEMKKNLV